MVPIVEAIVLIGINFLAAKKNKYLVYKHFLSPEHFFKYVGPTWAKIPIWDPHGSNLGIMP